MMSAAVRSVVLGALSRVLSGAALDFDFVNGRGFNSIDRAKLTPDSILTYTSPSPKMVYGNDGVLRYAPHNLFTYSEQFDNAAWTKTASSITANAAAAPDGTTTADALVENTATSAHEVSRLPGTGANTYTYSVYAKANGRTQFRLSQESGGASLFTLSGSGAAVALGSNTVAIVSVGDGWYRCSSTFTTTGAFGVYLSLYSSGATNYTGDGVSGVYLWGAQFSRGVTLFTYLPTTTAAVYSLPIDHNPTTFAPLGVLIEEQRTNLLTYSEQFDNADWFKSNITITANAATAPDGTTTADKIEATTSAATTGRQSRAVASTAATFSIYAKIGSGATHANKFALYNVTTAADLLVINFNYSTGAITYNVGSTGASAVELSNGWWRIILSVSSGITSGNTIQVYPCFSGGSETAGEYAYIWGAQLEEGAFATSYIPTVSQATRLADQVSILTSAFGYSATEGTMVAAARAILANSLGAAASVNDGTGNEEIVIYRDASGNLVYQVENGGANQLDPLDSGQNAANLTEYKMAAAWGANDFAAAVNGNAAVTDTSGTLPTVTTLEVGVNQANNYFNGTIKRLTYFPVRKTNAELQVLSR